MKAFFYMVLAALCLASIGVLVKLIGNAIPVMTLNFFKIFIGFLFLLAVTPAFDKKFLKVDLKKVEKYFWIGVVYACSISLYTAANLFAPVQNVVLIHYVYPFFVLPLAYILLKEKITKTKVITLIIAAIGIIIINPISLDANMLGNVMALISAILFALLVTEMRSVDRAHNPGSIVWFFFFATILLFPFMLIYGLGNIGSVLHYLILLGIIGSGLAYLLYSIALQEMEAETASVVAMILTPITSIILAVFLIGELIDYRIIIGGAILIFAGIYLEVHCKKVKCEEQIETPITKKVVKTKQK
jgi:drug/metabolite transporter (DMT)-like permease